MKKPWGVIGSPMASIPSSGLELWVTLTKIKIKEVIAKHIIFLIQHYKT
jgi:hypothetical protein